MGFMVTGDTFDPAGANNYKIYNGNGTPLAKYNTANGICEARANEGFTFKPDTVVFGYSKSSGTGFTRVNTSLNADNTIAYFDTGNPVTQPDGGWRGWKSFKAETEVAAVIVYHKILQSTIDALKAKNLILKVDGVIAIADKDYIETATVTIHSDSDTIIVETAGNQLSEDSLYVTVSQWYEKDLGALDIKLYVPPPTFTQDIIAFFADLKLAPTIDGKPINAVDVFNTNSYLKLTVIDEGSVIKKITGFVLDDYSEIVTPPVIENDSLSAKIRDYKPAWLTQWVYDIELPKVVEPETPVEGGQNGDKTRGLLDVYSMNPNDVRKFTTEYHGTRFDGPGGTALTVDYSQYILNLITLPFSIKGNLVHETNANIHLGNVKTSYKADRLSVDTLKYNIGEIYTPAPKGNLLDLANKTTVLHLPFITPLVIDKQYVIGCTIQIEFVINLTNSDCDINIRSSALNEGKGFGLITSTSVNLNTTVPWGRTTEVPTNDPSTLGIVTDNSVYQAYIEVITNEAMNIDGVWTIPVTDEALVNTASGYIEVSNIDLVSKATRNEKDDIIKRLEDGILIK